MNLHVLLEVEVGEVFTCSNIEETLKCCIWENTALVFLVLEVVFLDVICKMLGNFCACHFSAIWDTQVLPGSSNESFVAAFASTNLGDVSPNTGGARGIGGPNVSKKARKPPPHDVHQYSFQSSFELLKFIHSFIFIRSLLYSLTQAGQPCDPISSTCPSDHGNISKNEQCIASGPGKDMYESVEIIAQHQFRMAWDLMTDVSKGQRRPHQNRHYHPHQPHHHGQEGRHWGWPQQRRHDGSQDQQQRHTHDPDAYRKEDGSLPASSALSGPVDFVHRFVIMSTVEGVNSSSGSGRTCRPAMGYAFAAGTTVC